MADISATKGGTPPDQRTASASGDDETVDFTADAAALDAAAPGDFVVAATATAVGSSSGSTDRASLSAKPANDAEISDDASPPRPLGLSFYLLFVGLSLAVFLAALDQTIVTVALSAIAADFNSYQQVSWVGIGFMLTAVSFIPSYGQLADALGRKPVFLIAVFIFELGSLVCAIATNMNILILGRAIAGLGGGGIFSLVVIIISDLVPVERRGAYNVDRLSWRWVFWINLPFGVITILTSLFLLRLPPRTDTDGSATSVMAGLRRIDWLGTALLIGGVVCVLIPLQGGGTMYDWNSPTVIAMFCVGGALLIAFVVVEARVAKNPVVPLELFRNSHVVAAFASAFFVGGCFIGLIFYQPVWYEVVKNDTATNAGVRIVPLIVAGVVASIGSGAAISATGHAFPFMPAGAVPLALGAGLLAYVSESSPSWWAIVFMILAGIGIGFTLQNNMIIAQFSVPESQLVGHVLREQ
ncbi:hypothetical protein HK405_012766, partial [Cladochytrium tenue]